MIADISKFSPVQNAISLPCQKQNHFYTYIELSKHCGGVLIFVSLFHWPDIRVYSSTSPVQPPSDFFSKPNKVRH